MLFREILSSRKMPIVILHLQISQGSPLGNRIKLQMSPQDLQQASANALNLINIKIRENQFVLDVIKFISDRICVGTRQV